MRSMELLVLEPGSLETRKMSLLTVTVTTNFSGSGDLEQLKIKSAFER